MKRTTIVILSLAASLLSGEACKETLPVYEEPQQVLSASIESTSPDTLYIVQDSTGQTIGVDQISLKVMVTNDFTQLLQGSALVSGRVNVSMISPVPCILPTAQLDQSNLVTPPVFQGMIALPPAHSAEFRVGQGPDALVPILAASVAHTDVLLSDSTRVITYAPVIFQANAEARLFERVQSIAAPAVTFKATFVQLVLHKL